MTSMKTVAKNKTGRNQRELLLTEAIDWCVPYSIFGMVCSEIFGNARTIAQIRYGK